MRPDAIILPSILESRYADHSLTPNFGELGRDTVIATSPLVVAVPENWADEPTLPVDAGQGQEVTLAELLRAATATPEMGGFGLVRPSPQSSTEGLVAT